MCDLGSPYRAFCFFNCLFLKPADDANFFVSSPSGFWLELDARCSHPVGAIFFQACEVHLFCMKFCLQFPPFHMGHSVVNLFPYHPSQTRSGTCTHLHFSKVYGTVQASCILPVFSFHDLVCLQGVTFWRAFNSTPIDKMFSFSKSSLKSCQFVPFSFVVVMFWYFLKSSLACCIQVLSLKLGVRIAVACPKPYLGDEFRSNDAATCIEVEHKSFLYSLSR